MWSQLSRGDESNTKILWSKLTKSYVNDPTHPQKLYFLLQNICSHDSIHQINREWTIIPSISIGSEPIIITAKLIPIWFAKNKKTDPHFGYENFAKLVLSSINQRSDWIFGYENFANFLMLVIIQSWTNVSWWSQWI